MISKNDETIILYELSEGLEVTELDEFLNIAFPVNPVEFDQKAKV